MFCSKCGNQLPDGAQFCGVCGTPQNAVPAQPAPGASGAIPQAQPAPASYGSVPQDPFYAQAPQEPPYVQMPQDQLYAQTLQDPSYGYAPQNQLYGQAPQDPKRGNRKTILIIGGIALVAILIVLVVVLANCAGSGGADYDAHEGSSTEEVSSANDGSSTENGSSAKEGSTTKDGSTTSESSKTEFGYDTSNDLARSVADDYDKLFKSDFSSKAMTDFADGLISKMPPGALDALAKQEGTSVEALKAELADIADASSMSSITPYLSMMDIQFTVYDNGQASTSDLNDINATLTAAGVKGGATNAVDLGAIMTITLKEDLNGVAKGTIQTQHLGNTGMLAVQIDGKWYLWAGNL